VFGEDAEVRLRLAVACLHLADVDAAATAIAPVFEAAERDGCPGGALTGPKSVLDALAAAAWNGRLAPARIAALRRWAAALKAPATPADVDPVPEHAAEPVGTRAGAPVLVAAEALSPRELDVLKLIAAGDSNKLIARAYDLSPHTVKRHVANILDKLGVQSRGQAAAGTTSAARPRRTPRRGRRRAGHGPRRSAMAPSGDARAAAPEHCRHRGTSPSTPPERLMTTTFADPVSPAIPVRPPPRRPRSAGRMDLYVSIHKALRSFMTDTLTRDRPHRRRRSRRPRRGARPARRAARPLPRHLRHENEFVHTAIEARQPAGSQRIADEHVEHAESIAALQGRSRGLRAASGAAAERLALRLYRHLALFVAENFQHMHIEETVHNALLWQHYSDAELGALHGRLMASISPQEHLLVARWMLPGVDAGRARRGRGCGEGADAARGAARRDERRPPAPRRRRLGQARRGDRHRPEASAAA
jgi:DNA-binding CsgD family transcriptional regulator